MRFIDKIIIHCSDSEVEGHDDIKVIDRWHEEKGYHYTNHLTGETGHVGYHYFIKSDGTLQYGRPLWVIGAHCRGNNRDSVGICLHGKTQFEREQFQQLATVCWQLQHLIQITNIKGHGFYNKKKKYCPGFDVYAMLKHWNPDIVIT